MDNLSVSTKARQATPEVRAGFVFWDGKGRYSLWYSKRSMLREIVSAPHVVCSVGHGAAVLCSSPKSYASEEGAAAGPGPQYRALFDSV